MFARPTNPVAAVPPEFAPDRAVAPRPPKRPRAWSLRNWPVRWKVFAIVLVPLLLATTFGALRVQGAMATSRDLRLAADRANVIPVITKYMSALDVVLKASSAGRDVQGAKTDFATRKNELQTRVAETDVPADVRSGVDTLLNGGQALLDKVVDKSTGLQDRLTSYAPLLLTAEDAINASVQVDSAQVRSQVQGLSRAVGARGQMTMQQMLVTSGAEMPEAELRTAMTTLAGTEPSTLFGMTEVLGVGSPDAKNLQQQLVSRMAILADPESQLVDNQALLRSIQTTQEIAEQIIDNGTAAATKSVQGQADSRRDAAIRDAVVVLVAIALALLIVLLVARALVKPLRVLRDGALKVAHTDLQGEIDDVRSGGEPSPVPLAVYTTEEIGQVAHAVDELHTQALLLAGDEARLRLLVNDMFETMSRRSRSLVDQQLALIDRLERNEEDPERLDSLFRLDHLAARLRRNSANLLVLADAQISRDQRQPVPLSTVINAAVSEVEDYRRVETGAVPECTVLGASAGGVIHLLAELIDNALRYSPPNTRVKVSAVRGSEGGVLLRIADSGLGMTDSDRRMANMRLQAEREGTPDPTPENARHMGLFVVGRLAARHGVRVGLRGPASGETGSGTTAEVYLPLAALVEGQKQPQEQAQQPFPAAQPAAPAQVTRQFFAVRPPPSAGDGTLAAALSVGSAAGMPVTALPRRSPGSSGITEAPAPPQQEQPQQKRPLPTPWWEKGATPQPAVATRQQTEPATASDTSAFFARRPAPARPTPPPAEPPDLKPSDPEDDDVIYQRMLSEIMGDPRELAQSPDLNWQTVWDSGWSAAAEAEARPIESRTEHGLPMRTPGARLVPGVAESDGRRQSAAVRDPEAVRSSIGSHFGGVRSGRSHARDTSEETDQG